MWHLDEVVITIAGRSHWVWRAVDQDGHGLDAIVQSRRTTKAAKRLLTQLLTKPGHAPKRMITDRLRSDGAARRQVMPNVEPRSHKGLNNRAETAHLPVRKRERSMQRVRSPGRLQRFVAIFSALGHRFVPPNAQRSAFQVYLHRLPALAKLESCDGTHGLKPTRKAERRQHPPQES